MRVGMTKVVTRLIWTTSLNRAIRTMMIMKVCSPEPRIKTQRRGERRGERRERANREVRWRAW